MATDYPIEIDDVGGGVRIGGIANFTDPDNQPASGPPFPAAATGFTSFFVDSPDGDPISGFDADANTFQVLYPTAIDGALSTSAGQAITAGGEVDGAGLGPTIPYVTVQAAAPTTYLTPIVVDTTAVTGATYAWDGSAYQKIADLLT